MELNIGDLAALDELDEEDMRLQEEKIKAELRAYEEEEGRWRGEGARGCRITVGLIAEKCLDSARYREMDGEARAEAVLGVTRISLDRCGVREIENLECVSNATHLYLQHNMIGKIQELEWLPRLTTLVLAHNNITVVENLLPLTNLRILDLSHNLLSSASPSEFPKSLTTLDLRANKGLARPYEQGLVEALPELEVLDGERLCGAEQGGDDDEDRLSEDEYFLPKRREGAEPVQLHLGVVDGAQFNTDLANMRESMIRDFEKKCATRMAYIDKLIEQSDYVEDDPTPDPSSAATKASASSSLLDLASHHKNLGTATLSDELDTYRQQIRDRKQAILDKSRERRADTRPSEAYLSAKRNLEGQK